MYVLAKGPLNFRGHGAFAIEEGYINEKGHRHYHLQQTKQPFGSIRIVLFTYRGDKAKIELILGSFSGSLLGTQVAPVTTHPSLGNLLSFHSCNGEAQHTGPSGIHCCPGGIFGSILIAVSETKSQCVYAKSRFTSIAANTLNSDRAASLEPWFPTHTARDVYLTLLHIDPPVPASLLKAALLRRATEDIHRIITIRSAKQALAQLLQRGSIGDDLWTRFTAAEKEIEEVGVLVQELP